jgi:hypothetical protein
MHHLTVLISAFEVLPDEKEDDEITSLFFHFFSAVL